MPFLVIFLQLRIASAEKGGSSREQHKINPAKILVVFRDFEKTQHENISCIGPYPEGNWSALSWLFLWLHSVTTQGLHTTQLPSLFFLNKYSAASLCCMLLGPHISLPTHRQQQGELLLLSHTLSKTVHKKVIRRGFQLLVVLWSVFKSITTEICEPIAITQRWAEAPGQPPGLVGAGSSPRDGPWGWASIHRFWKRYPSQPLAHHPAVLPWPPERPLQLLKRCSRPGAALLEPRRAAGRWDAPPPPERGRAG